MSATCDGIRILPVVHTVCHGRSLSVARSPSLFQPRGRRIVHDLTPTPLSLPSMPPPARMIADEEEKLRVVMEDSLCAHDESQWQALEEMMALSVTDNVAILELHALVKEEAMEHVHEEEPAAWNPALVVRS
ncbi:hypothetical protein D1007_11353 [Hordeum vulgare]|nr:hypothetical protein D1007_11353 [Hordeum vulgare]